MKSVAAALLIAGILTGQTATGLLHRSYREGEILRYRMTAANEGRPYQAVATGAVKRTTDGKFFEEFSWSQVVWEDVPVSLTPASEQFRERLSLDPDVTNPIPNLSQIQPQLIGPVTDFLNFYADLSIAIRAGVLNRAGDHFHKKYGVPNSWADGTRVLLGEDSIDFDLTLANVDETLREATLIVNHAGPVDPPIHLPAAWMRTPVVAGSANNFVLVRKENGAFTALVGVETFRDEMQVSLRDGKILSARLTNPVNTIERICRDAALTDCGDPKPHKILRRVNLTLEP
jgi:hypothetical protein